MEWIFGFLPSRCVRDRQALLSIQTPPIEWGDLNIRAPFEILLCREGQPYGLDQSTALSSALARPLGQEDAPWLTLGFPPDNHHHAYLRSKRSEGIRAWEVQTSSQGDDSTVSQELLSVLPELLRERFWGRVLWLDESLELWHGTPPKARWRLYLSARGIGYWDSWGPEKATLWWQAPEPWGASDLPGFLACASDEELRAFVEQEVQNQESDIAFALRWARGGEDDGAWDKRMLATFKSARDSPAALRDVLQWALMCEPKFAACDRLRWEVCPWVSPDERPPFYSAGGWVARYLPPTRGSGTSRREGWEGVDRLFRGEEANRSQPTYSKSPLPTFLLPPFVRRVRRWAGQWFDASSDEEARSRHRAIQACFPDEPPPLCIEFGPVTAHERAEAFVCLREFLAPRTTPRELRSLLKMS